MSAQARLEEAMDGVTSPAVQQGLNMLLVSLRGDFEPERIPDDAIKEALGELRDVIDRVDR